jgi:hypothetical protein
MSMSDLPLNQANYRSPSPPIRGGWPAARALAVLCWLAANVAWGDGFTAQLDPSTIRPGESAQLVLSFAGSRPTTLPGMPNVPGLQITYEGPMTSVTIDNGQQSVVLKLNYAVSAGQPGTYTIPAIKATVDGRTVASEPLTLRVLKPDESVAGNNQSPAAFLKLVPARTEVYLGEVLPLDVQLYYQNAQDIQLQPLAAEGFTSGKSVPLPQQQVVASNATYLLAAVRTTVVASRGGELKLGPAECQLNLRIPVARRRPRGSLFDDFFDDPFTARYQLVPRKLTSDPQTIHVLSLPTNQVPPAFTGAVGDFTFEAVVSPTNIAIGEPVTLTLRVIGKGALENVAAPPIDQWTHFKVYPPTSQVETTDPFGIEGTKTFQQVIVPEGLDVREVPALTFSFFDPARRTYRTLTRPAVPIVVRPSSGSTVLANANASTPTPPPTDIVGLKIRLGALGAIAPPLVQRPWFLGLQLAPVLMWLAAVIWRQRQDHLARNPHLVRRQAVARQVRRGLAELTRVAEARDADAFFVLTFRLLQEGLGERLRLPAASITEAVLDEQLQPRGVAPETLAVAHELFQACNQQRYAPTGTTADLPALVPKVGAALLAIRQLKL